jgi:hypothetical protein
VSLRGGGEVTRQPSTDSAHMTLAKGSMMVRASRCDRSDAGRPGSDVNGLTSEGRGRRRRDWQQCRLAICELERAKAREQRRRHTYDR